jgi:hypothetical protein
VWRPGTVSPDKPVEWGPSSQGVALGCRFSAPSAREMHDALKLEYLAARTAARRKLAEILEA